MNSLWLTTINKVTSRNLRIQRVLFAVLVAWLWMIVAIQGPSPRELPFRAIVHGHHVQPREGDLQAIGRSDVTPGEALEIGRLYRQLNQCRTPKCFSTAEGSTN